MFDYGDSIFGDDDFLDSDDVGVSSEPVSGKKNFVFVDDANVDMSGAVEHKFGDWDRSDNVGNYVSDRKSPMLLAQEEEFERVIRGNKVKRGIVRVCGPIMFVALAYGSVELFLRVVSSLG